jgi:hypothetical protein
MNNQRLYFVFFVVLAITITGFSLDTKAQTQRNPVLEEFTGTWCQWCPCGHTIMAQILASMPNAIMIGYHGGGGGDPWQNFPGNQIVSLLSPPFWPSATIDRTGPPDSRSLWTNQMNQRYNVPATVSITLEKTYNPLSRELNATVDVTALQNLTGEYRVTMILLEDGLVFSQSGNGSCPGASNYIHKHVVRSMINGPTGEDLNGGNPWNSGQLITKIIQNTLPEEVEPDSCKLVVLVHKVQSPLYNAEIQQGIKAILIDPDYSATISTMDEYYFGASSETAEYTAYIKNTGLFADTYNISLDFDGPGGWLQTFTTVNGTFNFGDTDTVTVNPGDSISVQVSVNANSINGYGKTTAQFYSGQASYGLTEFRFTTFGLDVLVVDDDDGENYEEYIDQELNTLGTDYGIVGSSYIPPNVSNLNTFNILIWNTGVTEPGINTDEMNSLKTFIDNGGNLYLNGVDLPYQMADPTSPYFTTETNNFFSNHLHASYIMREHPAVIVLGIDGDPITNSLGMINLVGYTGASTINHGEGHYVNQIEAADGNASNILSLWLQPQEFAGIKTSTASLGKIVLTSFGFETIGKADLRAAFAERVIDWLSLPVGVGDEDFNQTPTEFALRQNYPNPFNPSTRITYTVPKESPVTIKIYDLIGQEAAVLVDEVKDAGIYEINFNALNLSSGVYIYQMKAGDFISAKKMSILK